MDRYPVVHDALARLESIAANPKRYGKLTIDRMEEVTRMYGLHADQVNYLLSKLASAAKAERSGILTYTTVSKTLIDIRKTLGYVEA